jgi:hypothetical protein
MERAGFKRARWILSVLCLAMVAVAAQAKDVRLYKVTKGIHYQQLPGGAPAVLAENGYVFQANVLMGTPGSVLSATVMSQEGTVRTLEAEGDDELEFRNRVNSRNTLETRYPDGNFTFTINTRSEGQRVIRLPLTGSAYPAAPVVQNLSALQSVNANGYIVVTWDRFSAGGPADFIQLRLEEPDGDLAWESRDFGEPGALDGTATRAIIEPGELKPNTTYTARLTFEKISRRDETSYVGAIGLSTYHARTEFTLTTSGAGAPIVERYEVAKGRSFEQTSSAPPVPEPGDEFIFSAEVQASAPNLISAASVRSPSGTTATLAPNGDRDEFDFSESATSQGPIDAKYPPGNYAFSIQTASQGNQGVNLWLDAGAHPPAPRVHFDPSRRIAPDGNLTISWDPWPDGTSSDFIQLRIEDKDGDNVFETPDFDDRDALNGRATAVTIPVGTLEIGKDYEARLTFRRYTRIDSSSYPGALGIASYFARTKFDIRTTQPDIEDYRIEKGRGFEQASTGAPIPDSGDEFIFNAEAEVQGSGPNLIASATLQPPVGTNIVLTPNRDRNEFDFSDRASTEAAFEGRYPAGVYRFAVQTANSGMQTIPLNVPAAVYPPTPHVQFDPAVRVPADQPLVIRWDPWPGGTANDFIQLRIEDNDTLLFETPDEGDAGALNGLSTSATIPSGVLVPGRTHEARLLFQRTVVHDETTVPGADGTVAFFSRTDFDIETIPPDVQGYEIFKGRLFVQTNSSASVVTGYVFSASLEAETAQSVATAAIVTPAGRTVMLTQQRSGNEFILEEFRASQAALDAEFPDGNYILAINTLNEGGKNILVALTNSLYPNSPRLSDYAAAGHINFAAQFDLAWDPFAGGTATDYIDVQTEEPDGDEVFDTDGYGDADALNGLDTRVTIPPFALEAGRSYITRLLFEKVLRANDAGYPGAEGRVGYFAKTYAPIATTGPGNPPLLQNYRTLSDGRIQFNLTTLNGGTYVIQCSSNMVDWVDLGTLPATSNMASYVAPPPPTVGCCFYRAMLMR